MSTTEEEKPKQERVKVRRSSLRMAGEPHFNKDMKVGGVKGKRNSVSWGLTNTFQFKEMKAMFQESNELKKVQAPEEIKKHQEFVESRRKSIKNEFSIVKEMLKNKNVIEEEDEDVVTEEVKNNTDKNAKMGQEALNEEDSESESQSDKEKEGEGEGEKKNEKENKKEDE